MSEQTRPVENREWDGHRHPVSAGPGPTSKVGHVSGLYRSMTSKALRLSLRGGGAPQRAGTACGCDGGQVFAFFSNRLGCLGSLVVSLVGTAILVGVLLLLNGA